MMDEAPQKQKWPRAQKFELSSLGTAAFESYREGVVASRAEEGRASFDAARDTWARSFAVEPDDSLCLAEIAEGPRNLAQIAEELYVCGKSRQEVMKSMERLITTGLVLALPPAAGGRA